MKILKKNAKDFIEIKKLLQDFSKNPKEDIWNIKKMYPKDADIFRLKYKNIRIIYDIDFGNNIIIVHRIGYRKDIYK